MNKILRFTDLVAWQKGHSLVLDIYQITQSFPIQEHYGLVSQMQRCAVSITSNIAEGFSRKGKREKIQFDYISLGSLTELQNQLIIAKDLSYISNEKFDLIVEKSMDVERLLNGLIRSLCVSNY